MEHGLVGKVGHTRFSSRIDTIEQDAILFVVSRYCFSKRLQDARIEQSRDCRGFSDSSIRVDESAASATDQPSLRLIHGRVFMQPSSPTACTTTRGITVVGLCERRRKKKEGKEPIVEIAVTAARLKAGARFFRERQKERREAFERSASSLAAYCSYP